MITEDRPTAAPAGGGEGPRRRRGRRVLIGVGVGLVVLGGAFLVAAFGFSGSSLGSDPAALARVDVQAFGGTVESIHATGPGGEPIPVALSGGRIVPKRQLKPGEPVSVEVVVRRPGWVAWAAGEEERQHLTLRAPQARVEARWLTVHKGASPKVAFSRPVRTVAYGAPGHLQRRHFAQPRRTLKIDSSAPAGSVVVAASARSWERLGSFQVVTWFPAGGTAVAATPAAGSDVSPSTPLHLTFSKPVSQVLGSRRPTLSPNVPGHWRQADRHTLVFQPSGFGAPFDSKLKVVLPKQLEVVQADGSTDSSSQVEWTVPPGSTLRLQQLLAEAGYLPVSWKPKGQQVAATPEAQMRAAINPPPGHFTWRYRNTPKGLRDLWAPGQSGVVTKGAVMVFESEHEMETDGVAGPELWERLMKDVIAGKHRSESGYSYVYVSETLPETVTLWHSGRTVLHGAANTGIPGAETELGTFPVFEHLEETTMSGENPDGSHYSDPGIKWVSYFNGGDALHAFDRASFGTPQSLGCVEMPLEEAAEVWPYTPIGTLVTVAQ